MQKGHRLLIEWFRELRSPLRRYLSLRRGVSPNDLEDVAQEVFLRLLRYDIGELVTDPAAYLFKIAANVASEWSMKASNRLPHDPAWLEDLTNDRQPDNDVEREFEHRRLAAALNALPARAREVLRLHFSEGLRHEEIAERLAVSARIVKRDLITSYSNLRDALGGASASSGTLAPRFRAFPERSS